MNMTATVIRPDGTTQQVEVPARTTLETLAKQRQSEYKAPIVLAMVNGKLRELGKVVEEGSKIRFITMTDNDGKRTYRRGVVMLLQRAVSSLWGDDVMAKVFYSLGQGYYCELAQRVDVNGDQQLDGFEEYVEIDAAGLQDLKAEMQAIANMGYELHKESVKTDKAGQYFHEQGMYEKEKLLYYRRSSRVNVYSMDGMLDYYYGYMVPDTSYLKVFDLVPYDDGFVLLFPNQNASVVEPLETSHKLHQTLRASREWSEMLGIGSVGALNTAIAEGRGQDIILTQEALMEARIGELAEQIQDNETVKFVMIAGPSSSGKTSFANRLSIQLTARGLKPHPISLDDYYTDRENCPRNADGSYDFESLGALDVEGFNQDMERLLGGEEVDMPSFNFKTGKREYRGHKLRLGKGDILVIEGIHGLNDKMSYRLPVESKFRIYISALTQLNLDEHNPIPTTDGRLIRRIVRDARTRGTSAQETIAMWPSVRKGEEENIFPFQESADVVFNSALVYELAVLKVYAEPLLFQIPRDSREYSEAKRLLKFLDYFLPLPTEGISENSLVREFVGGSCFNV